MAKLVGWQVLDIRRRAGDGESKTELANEYRVQPSQIKAICDGRSWGWLDDELGQLLEELHLRRELSSEGVWRELIKYPRFKGIAQSRAYSWLKQYGIMRDQIASAELTAKRTGFKGKGATTFPPLKIEIPYELLLHLYKERVMYVREIREYLASMEPPITCSIETLLRRLKEYGLWEPREERMRQYFQKRGLGKWMCGKVVSGPQHPSWKGGHEKEREVVEKAFPTPLGNCRLGQGKAHRFRVDFWAERFVDRQSSAHLVVLLCGHHLSLITARRSKLGLPRSLETGRRLLQWCEENPTPCVEKRVCQNCGKRYSGEQVRKKYWYSNPGRYFCSRKCWKEAVRNPEKPCALCGKMFHPYPSWRQFCSNSCAATQGKRKRGQLLYESRIAQLSREGFSKRTIPEELKKRWATTYSKKWKQYPTSPASILKVIKAYEKDPERTEPVLTYRRKPSPSHTQEIKDECNRLYVEGKSGREVYEITGVAVGTVLRWAREKKIIRSVSQAKRLVKPTE